MLETDFKELVSLYIFICRGVYQKDSKVHTGFLMN